MIRAVIFDIDNTMYNFDCAHAAAMEALFRYGAFALEIPEELRYNVGQTTV